MANKGYRLSPLAEADLDEIWLYTRDHWSIKQADQYVSDIFDVCEKLANGERRGRAVDVRAGYLKYPSGSHFLYFLESDDNIDVMRIFINGWMSQDIFEG